MNPTHQHNLQTLANQGIVVTITRKQVKNINFRIKVNQLTISVPWRTSDVDLANALNQRLSWVIQAHDKLLHRQKTTEKYQVNAKQLLPLILWGKTHHDVLLNDTERLKIYRQQLAQRMPSLFAKWQPIVGKTANEQRIKKMKTRWGSCNTKAKRIWLSLYLPEYPLECTEYVIVHELCHLHYANHSPKFWAEVAKAMPDYQQWHDVLAGKCDE